MPVPLPLSSMGVVARLDVADAAFDALRCGTLCGEADVSNRGASP